jgi:hypothetical protein
MSKTMKVLSIFVLAIALLFPAILAEPALAESSDISSGSLIKLKIIDLSDDGQLSSDGGLTLDFSNQKVKSGIVDVVEVDEQIRKETINLANLKFPSKPVLGIVDVVEVDEQIREGTISLADLKFPSKPVLGIVDVVEVDEQIRKEKISLADLKFPLKPVSESGIVTVSEGAAAEQVDQISVSSTYPIRGTLVPNDGDAYRFYGTAGSQSVLRCRWSPAVSAMVGIADANGNVIWSNHYTGNCTLTATFNQSGYYYWFIYNDSSSTIRYNGSFTY